MQDQPFALGVSLYLLYHLSVRESLGRELPSTPNISNTVRLVIDVTFLIQKKYCHTGLTPNVVQAISIALGFQMASGLVAVPCTNA
jgi:hypothetical protein